MNQAKLRELIDKYKIKVDRDIGQLEYLYHFSQVSSRSILLCSSFYISKERMFDGFGKKDYLIKGFIDRWIFNGMYDDEIINRRHTPPELEYFLEIYHKLKTIWIKPKY